MAQKQGIAIDPYELASLVYDASPFQLNELAMQAYSRGMLVSGNTFSQLANEATDQEYANLAALRNMKRMVEKNNPSRAATYQKLISRKENMLTASDRASINRKMYGRAIQYLLQNNIFTPGDDVWKSVQAWAVVDLGRTMNNVSVPPDKNPTMWASRYDNEVKKYNLGAIEEFHPPWWARAARRVVGLVLFQDAGPHAFTLGNTVYYFVNPDEYMRAHELEHVGQKSSAKGVANFWAQYFGNTIAKGYTKNPFEVSAVNAEKAMKRKRIDELTLLQQDSAQAVASR
jgi:hypothetical protein